MEDNLNYFVNGWWNKLSFKWKMWSIYLYIEDDLNLYLNARWTQFSNTVKTSKSSLVSLSLTWAWHSSAPACSIYCFFYKYLYSYSVIYIIYYIRASSNTIRYKELDIKKALSTWGWSIPFHSQFSVLFLYGEI